jgi:hypothetical protein
VKICKGLVIFELGSKNILENIAKMRRKQKLNQGNRYFLEIHPVYMIF